MRFLQTAVVVVGLGLMSSAHAGRLFPRAVALPPLGANLDPTKKTVCTMTINSSDEKESFQKHLDPEAFNFVEFVRAKGSTEGQGNSSDSWFQNACKSGIKCDIVLISGHFGGTFFGSTGQRLSLDELEGASCRNDCSGILSHPKEVFLFGCNTLAGKQKDHRSQAEYVEVLVRDNYTRADAEAIAEARYGAFGAENKDRMKRTFQGVPYLYGFTSIGPSGKSVEPLLKDYFHKVGSYAHHFELISRGVDAEAQPNSELAQALRITSFTQCRGVSPSDPAYLEKAQLCALYNRTMPLTERIRIVSALLDSSKILAFMPAIQGVLFPNGALTSSSENLPIVDLVKKNEKVRGLLLRALSAVKTPVLKMDWLRFALALGWVSNESYAEEFQVLVRSMLEGAPTQENADAVCSISLPEEVRLDREGLANSVRAAHFRSKPSVQILLCVGLAPTKRVMTLLQELLEKQSTFSDAEISHLVSPVSALLEESTFVPGNLIALRDALGKSAARICATRAGDWSGTWKEDYCPEIFGGTPRSDDSYRWAVSVFETEPDNRTAHKILDLHPQTHRPYLEYLVRHLENSLTLDSESRFFEFHDVKDTKIQARLWRALDQIAGLSGPAEFQVQSGVILLRYLHKLDAARVRPFTRALWDKSKAGPGAAYPARFALLECGLAPHEMDDEEVALLLTAIDFMSMEIADLRPFVQRMDRCGWGTRVRSSKDFVSEFIYEVSVFNRTVRQILRLPGASNSPYKVFDLWSYLAPPATSEKLFKELVIGCAEGILTGCNFGDAGTMMRESAIAERGKRGF